MAFLQARRASFGKLVSAELHQMLSFVRSDFRIGQAASCNLVLLNEPCLPSHQFFCFEEGTGIGGKIRSLKFCSSLSAYLFQHVQQTFRNILAWFWILILTWNLIFM